MRSGHIGLKSHRKLPQCLQKLRSDSLMGPQAAILGFSDVDGEVFRALDFQGVRVGPEVDGVTAAPGGLAADGTVAGLIRVRRLRLDPEADRAAVA